MAPIRLQQLTEDPCLYSQKGIHCIHCYPWFTNLGKGGVTVQILLCGVREQAAWGSRDTVFFARPIDPKMTCWKADFVSSVSASFLEHHQAMAG